MSHLVDGLLNLHGWVALAVVFAVPALESSAFLGFVFPGEVAILLGGVLAYQGRIGLPATIVAAVAGAVIGDSVGYEIGKRYGRQILYGTIGRLVKRDHIDRASGYLSTKGGKAVFLGRFTAALRVLIPGMAGMSEMPYRTFAAWNVASGILWASGFVVAGYLGGSSYRHVESVAKTASVLLLLLVAVVGGTIWMARRIARHPERLRALAARLADRPVVAAFRTRYRRQLDFLARRFDPGGALGLSLTASLVLIGLTGWAFGTVAQDVLAGESLNPLDRPVLDFFVRHREPWLTHPAETIGALGSSTVLVPLLAAVAAWCAWRRRTWRPAMLLAGGYGGAVLLWTVVKVLVARPRPAAAIAGHHFTGYSFPSGHATQAVVSWGLLAALAVAATPAWPRKVAAWTACALLAVLVGTARIYMGAHWPTDVLGGWALGALWLSAFLTLARTLGLSGGSGRMLRTDAAAKEGSGAMKQATSERVAVAVAPGRAAPVVADAIAGGGGRLVDAGDAEVLVWTDPFGAASLGALLAGAPQIRWVQLPFAGVDRFLPLLDDVHIWTSTKGAYSEPVAEHALGLSLAGLRRLPSRARAKEWGEPAGRRLMDSRVTIVGGGGITRELIRLLAPFRVDVTVVKRTVAPVPGARRVVGPDQLDEALPGAAIVVLALSLTPETAGIIGAAELARMDSDAWLVNVARGRHVVTDDLVAALRAGTIGGAALDVTDPEPLPAGHPLWDLDNCLITPHTSNTWTMAEPLFAGRIRANLERYRQDEPLLGVVDVALGY